MAMIADYKPGSFIDDFKRQMAVRDARDNYANSQADARKASIGTAANFKTLPPGWDDFFDQSQRATDMASFDAGKPLTMRMGGDFGAEDSGRSYAPPRQSSGGYGAPQALNRLSSGNPLNDAIGEDLSGRNLEGSVAQLRKLGLIPQFDQSTEDAEMGARKFGAQRAQMGPTDLASEADSIDAMYGPRRAMRQAQTALDVEPTHQRLLDTQSYGEGARYWSPMSQGVMADQDRRAIERSTAPAEIQAEGAFRRAQADAAGRVGAAQATANGRRPDPTQMISTVIGNMTSKGAFGVDRNGRPLGPPPEIQQKVGQILMDFLNGQGNQQGGQPAPGGTGAPQTGGPTVGEQRTVNGRTYTWDGQGWK